MSDGLIFADTNPPLNEIVSITDHNNLFKYLSVSSTELMCNIPISANSIKLNRHSTSSDTDTLWADTFGNLRFNTTSVNTVKITENIIVSKNGSGDFTNIYDAIASIPAGQVRVISVYPGTYLEPNPLVVPAYVTIRGVGSSAATFVVAQNPNQPIFDVGGMCEIRNIHMAGANGNGGSGVYFNGIKGIYATVRDCMFSNLSVGCLTDTGPGILLVSECIFGATDTPLTTIGSCFYSKNGGDLRVFVGGCSGRTVSRIQTGAICESAFMLLNAVNLQLCNTGCIVNAGRLELQSNIFRYNNTSIVSIGAATIVSNGTTLTGSMVYDIDIQSGVPDIVITGARYNNAKINNPNQVKIALIGYSSELNNTGQYILGNLNVGSQLIPTVSAFGQGNTTIDGMYFMTELAGIWNDSTTQMSVYSNNKPIFSGLLGTSYLGGQYKFSGFSFILESSTSDTIIIEYWNGQWVPVQFMTTWDEPPYYSVAQKIFTTNITTTERKYFCRFGHMPNWVASNINEKNGFWVRFRPSLLLTIIPCVKQLRLGSHATRINSDGAVEYIGNARPMRSLEWDINTAKPVSSSPGNANLYISPDISVGRTENSFAAQALNYIGFIKYVPADMDTSCPISLQWSWTTGILGTVKWVIRWSYTSEADNIYTSSTTIPSARDSSITLVDNVLAINKQQTTSVNINFANCVCRGESNTYKSDLMWILICRDGRTDTCADKVNIVNFLPLYVSWREGAHSSMF